ncbi:ECF-type sigma factor [Tuwongella immobilis]|uniref:RNA polymerase sigma-70 ECF-like HTH domain-containing protein n=1 Tax=Tuwongella immobilis TaxID=692036 RepID=A0A6C2YSU1_9BACT|nr:ECF-type sigma factor [Tuwongella immobilis]VIP04444.1 extracytoplasmic sigma factor ecf : Marine sediment metagenome DNA, contig: S01H1_L07814 OS=marine sediment metagenome GN=S01H1_18078 PE=4 SV=1: Sigma70_ECF [Tuwongella immobilis]VTS06250.1 extracytoplasmic sigma factor ecf : Marine sediment metagenome DNA, contig: S01H1_L07814 OS=marine sediment metagenome GN=S01H1_18078 PE=4 SV=1: Sigma70_ECF [Tuwongella immobilis]
MTTFHDIAAAAGTGDPRANDEFFRAVYDDLRRLADRFLDGERVHHTLQPTALVHEAYLRLFCGGTREPISADREVFFRTAARAMRQILVDSARRKRSAKRGGGAAQIMVDPAELTAPQASEDLLALHEALERLAESAPVAAEVVSLRYFGGLTVDEAAAILGVSPRTAANHWAYARAWLLVELDEKQSEPR